MNWFKSREILLFKPQLSEFTPANHVIDSLCLPCGLLRQPIFTAFRFLSSFIKTLFEFNTQPRVTKILTFVCDRVLRYYGDKDNHIGD